MINENNAPTLDRRYFYPITKIIIHDTIDCPFIMDVRTFRFNSYDNDEW